MFGKSRLFLTVIKLILQFNISYSYSISVYLTTVKRLMWTWYQTISCINILSHKIPICKIRANFTCINLSIVNFFDLLTSDDPFGIFKVTIWLILVLWKRYDDLNLHLNVRWYTRKLKVVIRKQCATLNQNLYNLNTEFFLLWSCYCIVIR